ncbi:hypothetical protein B0H11DRAFT_1114149 [Mycena galericulata]|nr:hypothetical protein B0H11DRAFT_1114149 [Mycena galericulata]
MQDFPQELIDRVIDHLAMGAQTWDDGIRSCGLVCRQWLPRSRYHLFSDIVADGADHLRSFLEGISSSSVEILSLVRSLQIDFKFPNRPFDEGDLTQLCHCTGLISLRIVSKTGGSPTLLTQLFDFLFTDLPYLGRNSPSLSHFQWVNNGPDISLRTVINVIEYLPALQYLRIGGSYRDFVPEPPSLRTFPLHLHTLEILVEDGANVFFAWLMSLPALPNITSLTFKGEVEDVDGPLVQFFQRSGRALRFLSLYAEPSFNPLLTERFHRAVLSCTSNLRNLDIHLDSEAKVAPTLSVIASSASSALETIKIVVDFDLDDYPPTSASIPWNVLDQVLADPSFRTLQGFSLQSDTGLNTDTFSLLTTDVKAQMPLAHARGILVSHDE